MHFVLDGVILEIGETVKWDSGFKKRELIVKTEDENPQDIKIEFIGESCDKLDLFINGELVMVAFTIIGNQYQGKYYTNLRGIAIGERVIENGTKKGKSKINKEKKLVKSEDDLNF
jgi:single-strand DNA-binding protein